ncbi:MAG TPA: sigma 54-interacting transcriptional regulator, partial [Kofleriaceae bacterium]|nr:sigma 54-interacting transcriptional regulator [Kofleriaceae bacterium]
MPRLVVVGGPWNGCTFVLEEVEHTMGRDPACDLAIPDSSLSRRHLRLAPDAEGWIAEDLGSRNGSQLNQQPLTRALLHDGDVLIAGRSTLRFDAAEASPMLAAIDGDSDSTVVATDGGQGQGGHIQALLALADALLEAGDAEAFLERLADWMRRTTRAPRAAVFRRRGNELHAHASYGPDGREPARSLVLPSVAALAAGRAGKALWLEVKGADAGTAVVPVGAPAELLVVMPGLAALETDQLRFLACAGHLAAGLWADQARIGSLHARVAELGGADDMLAASPAMRPIVEFIERAAATDSTVLLHGESGTGKEVVARALHRHSRRSNGPFVAVNCAAISTSLLESELFGHERGAFTGAAARKPGRFELADRGTLLLDEVAELSPEAQAGLLRVLEEQKVMRLGGSHPIAINVRLIAATHVDLREAVAAGRFREDLYYRLSVLVASIPPLRERREDIAAMARHFVVQLARRAPHRVDGISDAAVAVLTGHRWPGNVRELRNVIERAVMLGTGGIIEVDDLPAELRGGATGPAAPLAPGQQVSLPMPADELERHNLLAALAATSGNKSKAARKP